MSHHFLFFFAVKHRDIVYVGLGVCFPRASETFGEGWLQSPLVSLPDARTVPLADMTCLVLIGMRVCSICCEQLVGKKVEGFLSKQLRAKQTGVD